jgi:hypothetical protein
MDAEPPQLVYTPCPFCDGAGMKVCAYAALSGEALGTVTTVRVCQHHPEGQGWAPGIVPPI